MCICSSAFPLSASSLLSCPRKTGQALWPSPVVPSRLSHLQQTDLSFSPNPTMSTLCSEFFNGSPVSTLLSSHYLFWYSWLSKCDANFFFHFYPLLVPLQVNAVPLTPNQVPLWFSTSVPILHCLCMECDLHLLKCHPHFSSPHQVFLPHPPVTCLQILLEVLLMHCSWGGSNRHS